MKEIWKDIEGYEGKYQVSNLGGVRCLNYRRTGSTKEKIGFTNKDGYIVYQLCTGGICKIALEHRLVAQAFIPNPNNYPCVNHKNEIKNDNRVENLEWCTDKYNTNYGTRNIRISKATSERIGVKVKDLSTGVIYNSIKECAASLNISDTYVGKICTHLIKNPKFNLEFVTDSESTV